MSQNTNKCSILIYVQCVIQLLFSKRPQKKKEEEDREKKNIEPQ